MSCLRDSQIIARSVNIIFALLCIHLICHFQSIFNDFAVTVCLLLLMVVVLYFTGLYIVYPV